MPEKSKEFKRPKVTVNQERMSPSTCTSDDFFDSISQTEKPEVTKCDKHKLIVSKICLNTLLSRDAEAWLQSTTLGQVSQLRPTLTVSQVSQISQSQSKQQHSSNLPYPPSLSSRLPFECIKGACIRFRKTLSLKVLQLWGNIMRFIW